MDEGGDSSGFAIWAAEMEHSSTRNDWGKNKVLEDGDHVRFGDVELLFTSKAKKKSEHAVAVRINDLF